MSTQIVSYTYTKRKRFCVGMSTSSADGKERAENEYSDSESARI